MLALPESVSGIQKLTRQPRYSESEFSFFRSSLYNCYSPEEIGVLNWFFNDAKEIYKVTMDNNTTKDATISVKSEDPSGGNVGDIWFKF